MKCIECGCDNCLIITYNGLCKKCNEKNIHQARLDKVLSKFKDLDCKRWNWSKNFDIEYVNEKFYIVGIDFSDEYIFREHIFLEAVEHLINDLERNE